MTKGFH